VSQLLTYQRVRLCANLLWFDLEKITVPTLILLGDSGKLGGKTASMIDVVRVFRMHCPHSQVVQIKDGGGTYCMIEKPQESAQAVSAFIKSLRG
jgi:pimeloyl-ACP methyl ester carboxylesterase